MEQTGSPRRVANRRRAVTVTLNACFSAITLLTLRSAKANPRCGRLGTMSVLSQVRDVRKQLALRPEELDRSKLLPIFVPASFFGYGNWPGPYELLNAEGLGLTWTILGEGQSMRYLDHRVRESWEADGFDWKAAARANLTKLAGVQGDGHGLCTHALPRQNQEIFCVAMMHPDGLGPSRLLLFDALRKLFPSGYRVALPEMSCGIAFDANLDDKETSSVQEMIDKCYRNGTRPLIPGSHSPDALIARNT